MPSGRGQHALFLLVCLFVVAWLAATLLDIPRLERSETLSGTHGPAQVQAAADRVNAAIDMRAEQVFQSLSAVGLDGGIQPADDLIVARRLSLALAGTIPSLEEIRYLESLPPERRLDLWLDHLLADRRTADYMAERFARMLVGVEDGPFLLYRRRRFVSWLADQFHANRSYDEIIRTIITATRLWTDRPETNFLTVAIVPGGENRPEPNVLAGRVSRALLGVRLDCAECHDHPFNEQWKETDFQQLAAYFGSLEMSASGIRDTEKPYQVEDRVTGKKITVEANVPFRRDLLTRVARQGNRPGLKDSNGLRGELAAWITHPQNGAFARATANRLWTLLTGRSLVEPVDDIPHGGPVDPVLDQLAKEFVASNFDLHFLIRVIAHTRLMQSSSRIPAGPLADIDPESCETGLVVFPLTRLRSEQVVGSLLQAASLETIDYESHILVKIARSLQQQEFVRRYGDAGAGELERAAGTIPQRLLLLNGDLVEKKIEDNLIGNAATRIAALAPDDSKAIEAAFLTVLSRRPGSEEQEYFLKQLAGTAGKQRSEQLSDLYWVLLNSTEFSWNH